ncbi:MAG: galactose-1-phosphate uridylyltransferase [Chitinophagales bacterium]
MPELRQDPFNQRWVVISTERAKRPQDFKLRPVESHPGNCPFCAGNEDKTPPEIWAFRAPGTEPDRPGWWIRTVPNKFPALGIEGTVSETNTGLHRTLNGIGAHEVIIESPGHQIEFYKHSQEQIVEILHMWRQRHLDLRQDQRLKYVLIFKNEGAEAGASLEHSHSQLIATPIIPKAVEEVNLGLKKYHQETNRCLFCDVIQQELNDKLRVVLETNEYLAYCPYASRFPFETWIIPKQHQADYGLIYENDIEDLAYILREVFCRMATVLGAAPYNLLLHSTPVNVDIGISYHWHIEILPRLTKAAGFEYGTDYYINPTPPELAAESIRTGTCIFPQ